MGLRWDWAHEPKPHLAVSLDLVPHCPTKVCLKVCVEISCGVPGVPSTKDHGICNLVRTMLISFVELCWAHKLPQIARMCSKQAFMVMGLDSVLDSADPWPSAKASVPPSVPPLAAHSGPSLHWFAAQGCGSLPGWRRRIWNDLHLLLSVKNMKCKRGSDHHFSISGCSQCKLPRFLPLLSVPCHGRCQGNSSRSGWWRDSRLPKASVH